MRSTALAIIITSALAALGGTSGGADGGPRLAWVAPAGAPAEATARAAVAAARARGVEAELRLPRDRFELASNVRYLEARGFRVRVVGVPAGK